MAERFDGILRHGHGLRPRARNEQGVERSHPRNREGTEKHTMGTPEKQRKPSFPGSDDSGNRTDSRPANGRHG